MLKHLTVEEFCLQTEDSLQEYAKKQFELLRQAKDDGTKKEILFNSVGTIKYDGFYSEESGTGNFKDYYFENDCKIKVSEHSTKEIKFSYVSDGDWSLSTMHWGPYEGNFVKGNIFKGEMPNVKLML